MHGSADADAVVGVPQKKLMLSNIIGAHQHSRAPRLASTTYQRRVTLPDALDVVSVDDTSGSCAALPHHGGMGLRGEGAGEGVQAGLLAVPQASHVEVSPMTVGPSSPAAPVAALAAAQGATRTASDSAAAAAAHERLARVDTAASLAKRRAKSHSPAQRQLLQPHRISNPAPSSSSYVEAKARTAVVGGAHHAAASYRGAHGMQGDASIASCSASLEEGIGHAAPRQQQQQSTTLATRRGLSVSMSATHSSTGRAGGGDMSPSVERLGIGTSQDTRKLALRSAELRKELRRLHDLNRQHQAQQVTIEASHRTDDSLDVIQREAEAIGHAIDAERERREALLAALEALQHKGHALGCDSAAVRMARNSVQRVLFERREAFDEWKQVVAVEHQRRAEAKTHALLQRQLASASAGDRAVRPPSVVRQERDALKELVARLQTDHKRADSACVELEEASHETKQRAADLLEEDDRLDERLSALQSYIASAQKMLMAADDKA